VPLAALLAAAMAVGLSFGPHPFGFHGWPKAPAPRSIDRVVQVAPKSAPIAVARSEPAARSHRHQRIAARRGEGARPARIRHAERAAHPPRRSPRHRPGSRHRPGPSSAPEPPRRDGGDDPVVETPDGAPVAQVPDRIPHAAEAKRMVKQELGFGHSHVHGHGLGPGLGHGHGHGLGHHGRH
jgi:hypothetical protein